MPIGDATKWYVDQLSTSNSVFMMLAKVLLYYFQLPLQYDTGTEILTKFCQSSTTRLSDHVQEWHQRRSTCHSLPFKDHVYLDWFLKSLLSPIGKDVVSHFLQNEEEALQAALRYDLIYAQSVMSIPSFQTSCVVEVPMHWGHLTLLTVSLDPFHTLHHILSRVMAIRKGERVPPKFMPLLLATCFQSLNQSTKLLLLLTHSLVLQPLKN